MDPTVSPPWRTLEAPAQDGTRAPSGPAPSPTGAERWRDPAVLRVAAVVALAVVVAVVAFGLAMTSGGGDGIAIDVEGSPVPGSLEPAVGSGEVVVEIVGAVAQPGVLRLPAGSRVADLIAAAGGYGPRVDTARAAELHLATVLADGDRIVVPSRDDVAAPSAQAASGGGGGDGAPLDLNTATLEQLDTLPGIGPVTAQKILDARAEAPFTTVDELRSRGVLGEKTFERLRDLVTVP